MIPELPRLLALDEVTFAEVDAALGRSLQQWSQQPKLSTALLKALAVQRQPQVAALVLQSMAFNALEVNGFHCSAMISALPGDQWPESLQVLEDYCLDAMSVNAALKVCEKGGQWQVACQLLNAVEVDVIGYNTCLSACGKNSQWSLSQQLLGDMQALSLQADQTSYNSVMLGYSRASDWQRAINMFQELTLVQLQGDRFSFLAAITAAGSMGHWQIALALLIHMTKPSAEAWNAGITACEKGNEWPWALSLLSSMPSVQLQADIVSFNAMISSCSRTEWPLAIHLLDLIEKAHLELDLVTFSSVIDAACWDQALHLLRRMHSKRLPPNDVSLGAAINACADADLWREAVALLFDMPQSRLTPNIICYNASITGCVMHEWEVALELWRYMTSASLSPTLSSYSAVIRACSEGGRWLEALDLFQKLQWQRLRANLVTCSALCTACEKDQVLRLREALSEKDTNASSSDNKEAVPAPKAKKKGGILPSWMRNIIDKANQLMKPAATEFFPDKPYSQQRFTVTETVESPGTAGAAAGGQIRRTSFVRRNSFRASSSGRLTKSRTIGNLEALDHSVSQASLLSDAKEKRRNSSVPAHMARVQNSMDSEDPSSRIGGGDFSPKDTGRRTRRTRRNSEVRPF
eukprot:s100_g21.t2